MYEAICIAILVGVCIDFRLEDKRRDDLRRFRRLEARRNRRKGTIFE